MADHPTRAGPRPAKPDGSPINVFPTTPPADLDEGTVGMSEVAVLIPYFNPVGYRSHLRKFQQCRSGLAAAGMLSDSFLTGAGPQRPTGMEVAFWDRSCPFMWHRERLVNLAARELPRRYSHVVWLDSDVIVDTGWKHAVRAAFEESEVIQAFRTAHMIDDTGSVVRSRPSLLTPGANGGAVGIGWGACRSLFTDGPGLFELGLVGGADTVFAKAIVDDAECAAPWLKDIRSTVFSHWSAPLVDAVDAWLLEGARWRGEYAAVAADAEVRVVEHGAQENRHYTSRHHLLGGLDPAVHLLVRPGRVFRWTPAGLAAVEGSIRSYFHARCEDGPSGRPISGNRTATNSR
ncbi:hypothetical protein ACFRMQ_04265 [Kitasatospora sp. NPDC056783]|uniref:hypothetical protein n=1 Tax=Kitasatospora sp. NPDC056783 TaxID=3345943 RepID=UPI00369E9216